MMLFVSLNLVLKIIEKVLKSTYGSNLISCFCQKHIGISPLSKFTESLTEVSLSQIQIIAFIDYKNYFRMFIAPSLR